MKRTLCIAFLSAILLPCAVISSCGKDDEQQQQNEIITGNDPEDEQKEDTTETVVPVDPYLDTRISPDKCHAIYIEGSFKALSENGYIEMTKANIYEDTLDFCVISFPTEDLQGLSVSNGDTIYVRLLSVRKIEIIGAYTPEAVFERDCRVAPCE